MSEESRSPLLSSRALNVPNALSALRLVGVPLFVWLILTRHDAWALVVLAASGISDYLDGKIARTFGLITPLGRLLDPVADRLYTVSTLLCLGYREILPWWLVGVLLARDLVIGLLALVVKAYDLPTPRVHFVGKSATFNLLYAFPLLLLGDGGSSFAAFAQIVGWAFAWWGVALYWAAGALYAQEVRSMVHARSLLQRAPA